MDIGGCKPVFITICALSTAKGMVFNMGKTLKGDAIVIKGEHVNADTAMSWYLGMDSLPPQEIAAKFMAGINPEIPKLVKQDDILVCGRNFGFGKTHKTLWTAMKTIGMQVMVAESFATQLFQHALMYGINLLECPGILQAVNMGDKLEVDIESAVVKNITQKKEIEGKKMPQFLIDVMNAGGQIDYLAKQIEATKQQQSING